MVPENVAVDVESEKLGHEQLKNDIRMHLYGLPAISGVLVEETGEKLSFLEAAKRNLLSPSHAYQYLEAQVKNVSAYFVFFAMCFLAICLTGLHRRHHQSEEWGNFVGSRCLHVRFN